MGFFTGASDALHGALAEQERLRRQAMLDQIVAEDRKSRAEDRVSNRNNERERLDMDRKRYEAVDAEKAKKDAAVQAAAETEQTRNGLQAAIQGSSNAAGTSDPNGAKATRDALRVAMLSGGAKPTDIAQEPAAPKPVGGFSLSPGATRYGADGKVIAHAADRPTTPHAPGAPQIFYDTETGAPHAVQFMPDGTSREVALPGGLSGKIPPKAKPKTPDDIRAEAKARAAGAAEGKASVAPAGGGNPIASALGAVFGGAPAAPKPAAPAAGAPKPGDVKTFPNGSKGVYDGTGWVKQ